MNRSMAAKHDKARKCAMKESLDRNFRESMSREFLETRKSSYPLKWWATGRSV